MPVAHEFEVTVRSEDGALKTVEALGETVFMAIHIVERIHGGEAVEVVQRRRIEGKCVRCRSIVFGGDALQRAGRVICGECGKYVR